MKKHKKNSQIKSIILKHINNNLKEYLILLVIFIIGITLGTICIKNVSEHQQQEITEYINNFAETIKNGSYINTLGLLNESIKKNIFIAFTLWFMGCTVIGIPIVYLVIAFRGFCLGYTISSIIAVLGNIKGTAFSFLALFMQNLFFIPSIMALSVSGINLYKSIMRDRRKENIKREIFKHFIFSLLITIVLIISSLIEVYFSTKLIVLYF